MWTETSTSQMKNALMNTYEDIPCSVYLPNLKKPEEIQVQKVEKVVPSAPPKEVQAKKSCLTAISSAKRDTPPNHPALKKKTVAFGKTVNVSQTIEGTSRAARRLSDKEKKMTSTTNIESETDWKSEMQKEMESMKKELIEISNKKQDENMSDIKNMMVNLFRELKPQSIEPAPVETPKKISARQKFKNEGVLTSEAIEVLQKRIRTDPIFRQQVDDVLADAEYENNKYQDVSRCRSPYQSNPADTATLMRETYTVERSIRFDGNSIDSRNWQNSKNYDRYEPEVLHSTYQPGNSISYYPSENRHPPTNPTANNYYVEHVDSSENDENSKFNETRAEKERRIREKYSRRK